MLGGRRVQSESCCDLSRALPVDRGWERVNEETYQEGVYLSIYLSIYVYQSISISI